MRSTKKIVIWALALGALGVGFYQWRAWQQEREAQRVKFETTPIDRGPIVAKVTASGTLSALVTVQVGSQVSGRIKELPATFNTPVKKGQIIARIDPQLFVAALAQARANFAAAKGDLLRAQVQAANATRQLARARSLHDRNLTAAAEYDTAQAAADSAQADVVSAEARVAQTKAALNQAEVNLGYATITSPIDGIVISRSVDVGQTVASSFQSPILFTIAEDLRKMQVDTSVAEADVGKLHEGMPATFTVDAYPTERFDGTVREIRNAAQTVQNVVTYDAVIDVANPEKKLRPGMTANVTFIHAERRDVLRVANAALRFKPSPELLRGLHQRPSAASGGSAQAQPQRPHRGGTVHTEEPGSDTRSLWLLRGNEPVAVQVKLGITNGTQSEIVEGELREGEAAITDTAGGGPTGTNAPASQGGRMPFRRMM